jgi:hypothetical protein
MKLQLLTAILCLGAHVASGGAVLKRKNCDIFEETASCVDPNTGECGCFGAPVCTNYVFFASCYCPDPDSVVKCGLECTCGP